MKLRVGGRSRHSHMLGAGEGGGRDYTSLGLLFGEQFGSGDISPADNQNPVKSDLSSKDIYYLM